MTVVVVAVATTEELADVNLLVIGGDGSRGDCTFALTSRRGRGFRRDAHKGVPRLVYTVLRCFFYFVGYGIRLNQRFVSADFSRDIIAAIDVVDKDKVRGMLTVDVDKSMATDISLTGTAKDLVQVAGTNSDRGIARHITGITAAIHVATDFYLRLCPEHHRGQKHHQAYYDMFRLHLFTIFLITPTSLSDYPGQAPRAYIDK